MFSLKVHAIMNGSLLAAIIVTAMIGNVRHNQSYIPPFSASQLAARVIFFTLFRALGYSRANGRRKGPTLMAEKWRCTGNL